MKHFKSVFDNEQELLKAVLSIHNNGNLQIDVDPTYFKGNFYKDGIPKPLWFYDINPELCSENDPDKPTIGDAINLNHYDVDSIILDPPFMFGNHGKQKEYYASTTHTIYKNFGELKIAYIGMLKEAHRVLRKKGLLIFKSQDYTDNKTTMTHVMVCNWATELGFYAKDLAILVKPNKVYNPHTTQRHLRKIHTYFWIFEKRF